ncbi:hypothetical protein NEOLEDRAFT_1060764 [Neolentinus lepideus HHB14362 ss-1]|uniref:Uncharacterized protein n=1 Tax=Neolentinus lepideus HHB14362 ss-1 TaxID=1314782 RepID=A0A165TWM9_9AGAM|nr:hypothetical protein NEOLEDRAFT_1060764 [Neolentinus lepideus HHB14362 ss-1]
MRQGAGTSVNELCEELLNTNPIGSIVTSCDTCNNINRTSIDKLSFNCYRPTHQTNNDDSQATSIKDWIVQNLSPEGTFQGVKCCRKDIQSITTLTKIPRILAFHVSNTDLLPDKNFTLQLKSKQKLNLRGLIYFGDFHFTSRFISKNGDIWFNDRMTTGRECRKEGNIESTNLADLLTCGTHTTTLLIYACG